MDFSFSGLLSNPLVLFSWYTVVLIMIGALAMRFTNLMKNIFIRAYYKKQQLSEKDSDIGRQITIIHSFVWVIHVLIGLSISMMIANKAGLPQGMITSLGTLIGAGVGFGSQEIFRDIFKGSINLGEKQFSVGDTVKINTSSGSFIGVIEKSTLRYVAIRTVDNLTCIPQGMITVIENYNSGNGTFMIKLPFPTDSNLGEIVELIKGYMEVPVESTSKWINDKEQEALKTIINTEILGISEFDKGNITFSISGETVPGNQFAVKRALMKYLAMRLNEDKIYFSKNMLIGGV